MRVFAFLTLIVGFVSHSSAKVNLGSCKPFSVVQSFNLTAYMGVWYEIRRFPAIFEKGLYCGYATYNLVQDSSGAKFPGSRVSHHSFMFDVSST